MKRSERDAILLNLIRLTFGEVKFTAGDIAAKVAGLAEREHRELGEALGPYLRSSKAIGHWLKAQQGATLGDFRLVSNLDRKRNRWTYAFRDLRKQVPGFAEMRDRIEHGLRMETAETASRQSKENMRELDKLDEKAQVERARVELDKMQKAVRVEIQPEKKTAQQEYEEHVAGLLAAGATRLTNKLFVTYEAAAEIIAKVHRPERNVEAFAVTSGRLCQTRDKTCGLEIYLTGPLGLQKLRWQQLEALFRQKGWSSYGSAFDGATPELRRGARIPSTASRDPSHYDTARTTVAIANSLAAQGISSTELSLEEAVLRNRAWQNWNQPRGNGMLNPGPHFGQAVAMGGGSDFDVLNPSEKRWSQKL